MTGNSSKRETMPGLRAWFWSSIGVASVAGVGTVGLVTASLIWGWVGDRIGSVPTSLGAIVVATLASAGAARTLRAQGELAERNRREDIEAALWKRYDEAAKQLGSDQGFAVRSAGVYSLAGLASEWIRHRERMAKLGETDRDKYDECDTIVSILCAQLKKMSHLDRTLTEAQRHEEEAVNDAIIGRLQIAFQRGGPHGKRGAWAGGIRLDLRGADLSDALLAGVDFTGAVLKNATLLNAEFKGAILDAANLSRADVRLADFTNASMHNTIVDGIVPESPHSNTKWPAAFVAEMDADNIARMVRRKERIGVDASDSRGDDGRSSAASATDQTDRTLDEGTR